MAIHLFAKFLIWLPVPKDAEMNYEKNIRQYAKILVYEFFELRFMNDFWQATMGIFVMFASLNFEGISSPNISSFLSFAFFFVAFLTPIYTSYVTWKHKSTPFVNEETITDQETYLEYFSLF